VDGALGRSPQMRLQLGEGLLDRVEVRAVGREEQQRGTGRFDRLAGALWLDRLSMTTMSYQLTEVLT
jgi:hypothetical protein